MTSIRQPLKILDYLQHMKSEGISHSYGNQTEAVYRFRYPLIGPCLKYTDYMCPVCDDDKQKCKFLCNSCYYVIRTNPVNDNDAIRQLAIHASRKWATTHLVVHFAIHAIDCADLWRVIEEFYIRALMQ